MPHRSHDDGKKLDISFLYHTLVDQERINQTPTWLGYGFSEGPKEGEYDQISVCEKQGYWQYSLISKFVSSRKRTQFVFDESANAALLRIITRQAKVKKIFIEPHLKKRLGLEKFDKIRFHGCKAVRHDDHIHLQI